MQTKKVIVALSGGVDSTMSAFLLKQKNYDVTGYTFVQTEDDRYLTRLSRICQKLDIPLQVEYIQNEFNSKVINSFIDNYKDGLTPSPCLRCNKSIKWNKLLQVAAQEKADFVATGHYAQIKQHKGRYFISAPEDDYKDQTYFLSHLGQAELSKTLFPLGGMLKKNVRLLAKENGLEELTRDSESFSLCFLKNEKLEHFLRRQGLQASPGKVFFEGKIAGEHRGLPFYTVGQKIKFKGQAYYVLRKDLRDNSIHVVRKEVLFMKTFNIHRIHLTKYRTIADFPPVVGVKINGKAPATPASIQAGGNGTYQIVLSSPLYAPAPGQAIALYEGKDLLGGAEIK